MTHAVGFSMTFWYPRHMLQVRVGIFYGGATLSGVFRVRHIVFYL